MSAAAGDVGGDPREATQPGPKMTTPHDTRSVERPSVLAEIAGSGKAVGGVKINGVRVAEKDKQENKWNTSCLGQRIAVDVGSAAVAGALVAPVITMIDKAIISNASGRQPLVMSLQDSLKSLVFQPHRFLTSRPFALIFALYSGTYLTANALDSVKATVRDKPASTTSAGPAKFFAVSAANLSLCLYKDSQFTKLFGTASTARAVPGASYALFAVRDCLTIFASFNLPPLIAPLLPVSSELEKYASRATAAQFLAPAAIQLVSTPLHLLGLDLYNRNGGTLMSDRLRKVRVDWLPSALARMCRIVPAFGVGGVVNTSVRRKLMQTLE